MLERLGQCSNYLVFGIAELLLKMISCSISVSCLGLHCKFMPNPGVSINISECYNNATVGYKVLDKLHEPE